MKILFLDIDGVINTVGAECGFRECYGVTEEKIFTTKVNSRVLLAQTFDPAALWYLRDIVEKTGCKIVISSTWRHGETLESMKGWFNCPVIKEAIIDKTPSFSSLSHPELKDRRGYVQRGEEIKWWVDQHPEITAYAVLDDDSDMDVVYKNFFETDSYDGLRRDIASKVIQHLNHRDLVDHYRIDRALCEFLAELHSCFGKLKSTSKVETDLIEMIKNLHLEEQRMRQLS